MQPRFSMGLSATLARNVSCLLLKYSRRKYGIRIDDLQSYKPHHFSQFSRIRLIIHLINTLNITVWLGHVISGFLLGFLFGKSPIFRNEISWEKI